MIPIQFITQATARYSHEDTAILALRGGCKWIQLRMKDADDDEVEPIARRLLKACRNVGATLIIDDRVELVKAIEADGVHLGKKDMPVDEARTYLGEGFLIGGTANTIDDVRKLYRASADYIGCGPFHFTTTKKGLAPLLGCDGLRRIMGTMVHEAINVPVVAIGGITRNDIPDIMGTGVDGLAVSGAIVSAADPIAEMKAFIEGK